MSLLFAMLPLYLAGNFHCFSMCGPLAMMLGRSPNKYFYLLGRILSFTLAGVLAGGLGEIIGVFLQEYSLGGSFSILVGMSLVCLSIGFYRSKLQAKWWAKLVAPVEAKFQRLLLLDEPWPIFLFGFLTIALPCGQTLLVYSACALSGSAWVGGLNGFVFAFLTTPALYIAMQARHLLKELKKWYRPMVSFSLFTVGSLFLLRGAADLDWISHFSLGHFVFF